MKLERRNEFGSLFALKLLKNGTWLAQKLTNMLTTKECPVDNNQRTKKVQNHVQILKFKLDNNKIHHVID
jgi:hypothetical protein